MARLYAYLNVVHKKIPLECEAVLLFHPTPNYLRVNCPLDGSSMRFGKQLVHEVNEVN